jgi:protein tyrosine phosphatase (PTP) superfamily phosphohydrolase (DUF442 family)
VLALGVGAFAAWAFLISDNFGVVEPGRIYRSAQLRAEVLRAKVREHGIRTVLNLRGSHPELPWYREERSTTLGEGATQVDIALSSCEWMSRPQARALVEAIETAERPLLVHCFHGSERTALVSSFAELLRAGSTLADARAQFSARFLFFNVGDGVVTLRHLEAYETWLTAQRRPHTPEGFRHWILEEYRPGQPCREQWEYDPYPLVVVTKPVKQVADRRDAR